MKQYSLVRHTSHRQTRIRAGRRMGVILGCCQSTLTINFDLVIFVALLSGHPALRSHHLDRQKNRVKHYINGLDFHFLVGGVHVDIKKVGSLCPHSSLLLPCVNREAYCDLSSRDFIRDGIRLQYAAALKTLTDLTACAHLWPCKRDLP